MLSTLSSVSNLLANKRGAKKIFNENGVILIDFFTSYHESSKSGWNMLVKIHVRRSGILLIFRAALKQYITILNTIAASFFVIQASFAPYCLVRNEFIIKNIHDTDKRNPASK